MVLPGFHASGELGQGNDRHVQFPGQALQGPGNLGNFLLPVIPVPGYVLGLHELEVVDHDDVQPMFRLQAAALGPDFRYRNARRIVDIEGRIHEDAGCIGQLVPFLLGGNAARPEPGAVHQGRRAEQALYQLFPGHFQGEEGHAPMGRGNTHILCDIQDEGRFTHGRAGSDDDEIPLLEPACQGIQGRESAGQAGDGFLVLEFPGDFLQFVLYGLSDGGEV